MVARRQTAGLGARQPQQQRGPDFKLPIVPAATHFVRGASLDERFWSPENRGICLPDKGSVVCLLRLTSVYSDIENCCVVPAFGETHQWAQAHFLVCAGPLRTRCW